jgi:hypothetical protein
MVSVGIFSFKNKHYEIQNEVKIFKIYLTQPFYFWVSNREAAYVRSDYMQVYLLQEIGSNPKLIKRSHL